MIRLIITLIVVGVCLGQNMPKKPKELYEIATKELPYIACEVCMKSVGALYDAVVEARGKAYKNRLGEAEVVDIMDNICKPENKTGYWIRKQDIVLDRVSGSQLLHLEEPGGVAKCKDECTTIAKSCTLLYDEELDDLEDLTIALWKNKMTRSQIQDKACKVWTKRCKSNKNKYLPPKFKRKDHEFEPISEKDLQMEEMVNNMNSAGLGQTMSMYSRDDMMNMMDTMEDEDEEMYDESDRAQDPSQQSVPEL